MQWLARYSMAIVDLAKIYSTAQSPIILLFGSKFPAATVPLFLYFVQLFALVGMQL